MRVVTRRISEVEADILVNAANGIGVMGAGVAADLARSYPWVGPVFRAACLVQQPEPGEVILTCPPNGRGPVIWHAVTMKYPGTSTSLPVVARCLSGLYIAFGRHAPRRGTKPTRIAIPALGTGHGRLRPDDRYLRLFQEFVAAVEPTGGEVILVGEVFLPIQSSPDEPARRPATQRLNPSLRSLTQ